MSGSVNPTATVRTPYLQVKSNGTALSSSYVRSATCSMGYDQQIMEATVVVKDASALPARGAWITVKMGASSGTATIRFAGYLVEYDYSLWPYSVSLLCKGPLIKAQQYNNPTPNGTDLTNSGVGKTDQAMITQILTACGVVTGSNYTVSIGGTGRVLGKVATKYYKWYHNDDGLSAIQNLDQICLGYRLFESIDGSGNLTVTRLQVSILPSGGSTWSFTEGTDIYEATHQDTILNSYNSFLVAGFNPDKAQANATTYTHTYATALPWTQLWSLSSSLIEYANTADRPSGEGMSCQEVAEWANTEYNSGLSLHKIPFTTPRDDLVLPGQIFDVSSTHLNWVGGQLWVQNVVNEITEANVYSQRIVGITGDT